MKKNSLTLLLSGVLLISIFLGFKIILSAGNQDWVKINTPNSPVPPRAFHKIIYDSHRDKIVLFGGSPCNDCSLNDLWEYDGMTWEQKFPPNSPSPRYLYDMVYDSNRNVIVLFGGESWPTIYNDTWEYDGTDWRRITTPHLPQTRAHLALAYDSKRKVVVLFGGWHWYQDLGDTWEYDGTDWTQRFPSVSPSPRQDPSMVYDEHRGVVVLFGGKEQYGVNFNDTWEWDGTNWTKINTPHSPSPRLMTPMTYDKDKKKVILFGDYSFVFNDTWEYDGTDWTQINTLTSPEPRRGSSIAYHQNNKRVVLFGGYIKNIGWSNDTWELVSLILESAVDIKPDTLNLKSKGKWITAYIELPEGYNVDQIDISTVAIVAIDETDIDSPIYAELSPTKIDDHDNDGILDLMVKFDRQKLIIFLKDISVEDGDEVEVTVAGELIEEKSFEGSDTIEVINKKK
ncbi:MAG: Kelch repeat-containing protein [Methanosarcinales archaeon]